MTRFDRVKQILDAAVGPGTFAAHGPFWRPLNRDAFVVRVVFGRRLVEIGNGAASNLVKALRGEPPFGSDVGTPQGIFRRMPAGRPPVPEADIQFIKRWIDEGCLEDDLLAVPTFDTQAGGSLDPVLHNAFWRDFDNWAMFDATPEVTDAINVFFGIAFTWMEFARDPAQLPAWETALESDGVADALTLLSTRQADTVARHYGNPTPLLTVLDAFEQFGAGRLPDDPLRPGDPHSMNGPEMWFFWSAFADGCIREGVADVFWQDYARAVLAGLMHDGLFRGRFTIQGFDPADPQTPDRVRASVRQLPAANVPTELARRFRESGLGTT
jgi:hypothetical protein